MLGKAGHYHYYPHSPSRETTMSDLCEAMQQLQDWDSSPWLQSQWANHIHLLKAIENRMFSRLLLWKTHILVTCFSASFAHWFTCQWPEYNIQNMRKPYAHSWVPHNHVYELYANIQCLNTYMHCCSVVFCWLLQDKTRRPTRGVPKLFKRMLPNSYTPGVIVLHPSVIDSLCSPLLP